MSAEETENTIKRITDTVQQDIQEKSVKIKWVYLLTCFMFFGVGGWQANQYFDRIISPIKEVKAAVDEIKLDQEKNQIDNEERIDSVECHQRNNSELIKKLLNNSKK